MTTRDKTLASEVAAVLVPADNKERSVPIWLARGAASLGEAPLTDAQRAWAEAAGFEASGSKHLLIPGGDGTLAGVAFGIGEVRDPMAKPEILLGALAGTLPPGLYHVAGNIDDAELAAVAWGLGAYRFRRYKTRGQEGASPPPRLKAPGGADLTSALATVEAVWMGRDLINTPAGDLGPQELEDAARQLAKRHRAGISSVVGDDLLAKNFPMIHAVGRASSRPHTDLPAPMNPTSTTLPPGMNRILSSWRGSSHRGAAHRGLRQRRQGHRPGDRSTRLTGAFRPDGGARPRGSG